MREIKFRIWDKKDKKFLCDDFANDKLGYTLESLRFFYKIEDESVKIDDRYVFQQFTGLKDQNGREIYEGDILKDENALLYEVFWLDTTASFELAEKQEPPDDYNSPTFHFRSMARLEVVGNIFGSPELRLDI